MDVKTALKEAIKDGSFKDVLSASGMVSFSETEFKTMTDAQEAKLTILEGKLINELKRNDLQEINTFCESNKDKLTPAILKDGFKTFLLKLKNDTDVHEFSETNKSNAYDYMLKFVKHLPAIDFSEKANDVNVGNASDKLDKLVQEKMKNGQNYSDAFTSVQLEHPDIALQLANEAEVA